MATSLLIQSLLVGLVAYRLWRILGKDTISEWFRDRLDGVWGGWALEGFTCPWCLGFWLSLATAFTLSAFSLVSHPLVVAFAASTVVGFLGRFDDD